MNAFHSSRAVPLLVHGPHLASRLFGGDETDKPNCYNPNSRPYSSLLTQTQCASHNYGRAYSRSVRYVSRQQHLPTRCSQMRNRVSSLGLTKRVQKSLSTSLYVVLSSHSVQNASLGMQMTETVTHAGPIRWCLRCWLWSRRTTRTNDHEGREGETRWLCVHSEWCGRISLLL